MIKCNLSGTFGKNKEKEKKKVELKFYRAILEEFSDMASGREELLKTGEEER